MLGRRWCWVRETGSACHRCLAHVVTRLSQQVAYGWSVVVVFLMTSEARLLCGARELQMFRARLLRSGFCAVFEGESLVPKYSLDKICQEFARADSCSGSRLCITVLGPRLCVNVAARHVAIPAKSV